MIQYKVIVKLPVSPEQSYWLIEDGKIKSSCLESDPEYQEWLAEGNEPLPAD
tara:strand:+ start:1035 stop:1190 length:156 start_codon:yes stop_codon:yes gene_type:complete